MKSVTFGYAGQWAPSYPAVTQAAFLVKSDATPVGVEGFQATTPQGTQPFYRVVTNNEYTQAAQAGRLVWTAIA